MVDPEVWGLIAKRGKGGLWRVTYGDTETGLTDAEYLDRRATAFKKFLPGHPDPGEYKITETDQYRIHNRCVDNFKVGRIILAADAAHVSFLRNNCWGDWCFFFLLFYRRILRRLTTKQVCNPFGGYGCMTAVVDVGALADCLIGYYEGKADESILDLYAEIRREKFLKYVDARSMKNMNRIMHTDPDTVVETDKFFQLLKGLEGDDEATKAFLLVST